MNESTRVALWPVGAALAGIVVGAIGLALTVLVANGADADGWGALGIAVMGGLASVGLAVLVWLSLLVAAARRLFPAGARLAPLVQSVAGVLGVVVVGVAIENAGGGAVPAPVVLLGALAAMVVPSAVFSLCARTMPRPPPPEEWPLPPR